MKDVFVSRDCILANTCERVAISSEIVKYFFFIYLATSAKVVSNNSHATCIH